MGKTGQFGTEAYAREELIAEIGSAFLCAALGIEPTVRHADYVGSWLAVLRDDDRAIFRAASAARKAANWLLDRHQAALAAYWRSDSDRSRQSGGHSGRISPQTATKSRAGRLKCLKIHGCDRRHTFRPPASGQIAILRGALKSNCATAAMAAVPFVSSSDARRSITSIGQFDRPLAHDRQAIAVKSDQRVMRIGEQHHVADA